MVKSNALKVSHAAKHLQDLYMLRHLLETSIQKAQVRSGGFQAKERTAIIDVMA